MYIIHNYVISYARCSPSFSETGQLLELPMEALRAIHEQKDRSRKLKHA